MWGGDDDVDENGEAVKLYVPAQGQPRRVNVDALDSHIGGKPYQRDPPVCGICKEMMNLLVQLRLPNMRKDDGTKVDRIVYVFACPKATCFESVKFVDGFATGNDGVMSCQSMETVVVTPKPAAPVAPAKSSWYADDEDDNKDEEADDDNDWGLDGTEKDDVANMAELEEAMAAMENNLREGVRPKQVKNSGTKSTPGRAQDSSDTSFPCFLLTRHLEPPAPNPVAEEDDVGLSANDEKIRNMLARYMAEEEDEDILAALKGTSTGGGNGEEEDERLTEEDRLLLGFQDRVRRVPRQVVRYARGGIPLWSIPSSKKGKQLWNIPTCVTCGTQCYFEMQLLPSLLHVLGVDQFSSDEEKMTEDGKSVSGIGALLSRGMNWGSVAVFTCPSASCQSPEGYLVIQAAVDENPLPVGSPGMDFTPTMAIVEDMDDDAEFEPYTNET